MKYQNKDEIIQEKYEDILRRKNEGYITDDTNTANIFHVLTYFKECVTSSEDWLEKITVLEYSKKDLEFLWEDQRKLFQRTKRIISAGDYWNDDEWVLILLFRLDLEMVKDFFHYRDLPFPADMDLQGLCTEMKELSQTKKNKRVFDSSVATMQKNSPLPFVDIWFEADRREEYLSGKY